VEIPLKAESLAYWDIGKHSFVVEEDKVKIMVGASSLGYKAAGYYGRSALTTHEN